MDKVDAVLKDVESSFRKKPEPEAEPSDDSATDDQEASAGEEQEVTSGVRPEDE